MQNILNLIALKILHTNMWRQKVLRSPLLRRKLTKFIISKSNVSIWSPLAEAFNSRPLQNFNLKRQDKGLFGVPDLRDPQGFDHLKIKCISRTDQLIDEALSINRRRKMVEIFDEISDSLCQVADLAEFIRLSHPKEEYNHSAQMACAAVSGIVEKLNTNVKLFEALKNAVREGDLVETNEIDKLVGELFLFDFEQCGIHLDQKKRNEVVQLNDDILHLGQEFVSGTANPRVVLRDMIPSSVRDVFMGDKEKVVVSGLYTHSSNPVVREMAYKIYLHPEPQQENILTKLLDSRDKLAKICGFKTYSERALKGSILDIPENVSQFLDNLNSDIWDMAQKDFDCMNNMKHNDCPGSGALAAWDVPYYSPLAKREWFNVSSKEYSPFFSLGACMDGLNMIFQSLYGIQLVNTEMDPGECWFADVYKLSVIHEKEGLLGYIYCDLYERNGKPNQDCHFTIRGGKKLPDGTYQLPIVVLMLNLPPPRWSSPSLLTPNLVDNLFHEMGHAMHSMLGRTQYQHVTGTRCSTDFAEVPSILMEYFASDIRVLKRFARHFQTQQPISEAMLQRLCASKHLFTASETQLQIFYAALDQECELEKLKSKIYFMEADLSELKSTNAELQKQNDIFQKELNHPDEKEKESPVKKIDRESPERFEMIDQNMTIDKNLTIESIDNDMTVFKRSHLTDAISNSSLNENDWTSLNIPSERDFDNQNKENNRCNRLSSDPFLQEIFSLCYQNVKDKEIDTSFTEILNQKFNLDSLVHVISESLLKIIPNIILNKREEAIPLLMCAIYLNSKATERDKLLQQLFNLKKKPSESERHILLASLVGIAKFSSEQLVENEILPQCWLQLTHKYIERRLLVVEACTVLIPFVTSPIRNSLVLSMLQQMSEDKDDIVRTKVVKALALLLSLCEDRDKYTQCEQLTLNTLDDSASSVVNLSNQILFPVIAKWASQAGYLSTSLLKKLLHKLNDHIKTLESQINKSSSVVDKIHRVISVIDNLLPFLMVIVAIHENVTNCIEKDMKMEIRQDFLKMCTSLTNPQRFVEKNIDVGTLLYEFDKFVYDNPNSSWEEMDYVVDIMLPDLLNNLSHINSAQQSVLESFMNLFCHICIVFGKSFTKYKIRPILQKKIQNLEQVISSFNQFTPNLNVIPIYLSTLGYVQDYKEIATTLKKFLCALPLCGSPLDCLEVTVRRLCEVGLQETVVDCLWAGVVHQRPLVKSAAATLFSGIIGSCDEELLKTKIAGALVTLASDSDILVRTATIPALGCLITNCMVKEIHDKAYMQLQSFINDTTVRDNHTLLRQLIVTLGDIVNSSSEQFRTDVIIPQLTSLALFTSQMTNQIRKVDMALALLEAYTHVVFSPLDKQGRTGNSLKPGLRCLESVILENQSMLSHHDTVLTMIRECDNKATQSSSNLPTQTSLIENTVALTQKPQNKGSTISQNVNQGVEEMRQRMSKIFQKPSISKSTTLPNLQGIFKKK